MRSIEIPITDDLMRKFAALQALTQGTEREILDVESFLQDSVIHIIEDKIRDELGGVQTYPHGSTQAHGMPAHGMPAHGRVTNLGRNMDPGAPVYLVGRGKEVAGHIPRHEDPSGSDIAEGLSYEDIVEDEPEALPVKPKAKAKAKRTVTKKDIEEDSVVSDPETEAVSSGEELSFEELLGGPTNSDEAEPSSPDDNPFASIIKIGQDERPPPSVYPRKQIPKNVKAKVSGFMGNESSSF